MTQHGDGPYVYLAPAPDSTVYHCRDDCPELVADPRRVPEDSLSGMRDPCRMCHSDTDCPPDGRQPSTRVCPCCGLTVTNAGQHLRHKCTRRATDD